MTNTHDIAASTDAYLRSRPRREPDYRLENEALTRLAKAIVSDPEHVLQILCEEVMAICGAESAGVSLLRHMQDDRFHWPAIAGEWSRYTGGQMPRSASPCGVVVTLNRSLIFHDVEQQYPAVAEAVPRIGELLLSPFGTDGQPAGTVWAIMHSDAKRFDNEDRRVLESLAAFAAAAFNMTDAIREAVEARAELSFLNHELSHRLKNMLSMVIAITTRTLRDIPEREAVNALQSRLHSLASAHDILFDRTSLAATVDTIAARLLELLGHADRCRIEGPDVVLGSRAALSLSLVLHELATNAIKYGAFSVAGGAVSFTWHVTDDPEPVLIAIWQEQDGPTVAPPAQKGFGSRLIEMGIAGQSGVVISYDPQGVRVVMEAPLKSAQEP